MAPLTCAKCHGLMRVIAVIEEQNVFRKILDHLGPWEVKPRPHPQSPKRNLDTPRPMSITPAGMLAPMTDADCQVSTFDNGSYHDTFI